MTKPEIREFLKNYCDEVYDMPFHVLELLMDDHRCIRWYGKEYFMPEHNSFYNEFEESICEHLYDNYCV